MEDIIDNMADIMPMSRAAIAENMVSCCLKFTANRNLVYIRRSVLRLIVEPVFQLRGDSSGN